jgi:predicted nucleotidyltransferase
MLDVQAVTTKLAVWSAKKRTICAVAIFGSYAKGRPRPDSDLDIAIVVDLPEFHERLAEYILSKGEWGKEIQTMLTFQPVSLHRLDDDRVDVLGRYLLDAHIAAYDPQGKLQDYLPHLQ